MKTENLWIIIPAHNEAKRIDKVIEGVKKYSNNVVVVDDGSSDNTADVAKSYKVHVLKHIINLGKGAALKTGCDYALKNKCEHLIVIDADGQHHPNEIPMFLDALVGSDVVLGYRKINRRNMPIIFRMGNSLLNLVTHVLYGIKIRDTQCGYRAFSSDAYKKIKWKSNNYSMESEMIANIGKHKLRYEEVPIQTIYSERYKGTTILDGIKIVIDMFIWRLRK